MKVIGKIIEFDGYSGTVIDENNVEHIFAEHDIFSEGLKVGDIVSFKSELHKTVEVEIYVARFVTKFEKSEA